MRRALVLTDESARHPFRASLPPRVRGEMQVPVIRRRLGITAADVRLFLMAYCACFMAASVFVM